MKRTFEEYGITGIRYGGATEQRTTCPECSPTRAKKNDLCLAVNIEKGTWHCHHCEWSGGLGEAEDWRKARVQKRIFTPFKAKPEPLKALDPKDVPTASGSQAEGLAWLAERGITEEVAIRNGIVVATHFFGQAGERRKCLAFPFRVGGEVVNVKYRTKDKLFAQSKGGGKTFYKIDDAIGEREVIITEGEIDALSWEVVKFPAAISVPDGAMNADAENISVKMRFLDNCLHLLEGVERFYLATDADANGRRLAEELARRLGKGRCYVIEYPAGCKDTNEVLVKLGPGALLEMYASAEPYPVSGVAAPAEFFSELDSVFKSGYPEIAGCGDPGLDELLRFAPYGLTVVTGIPGHGKSNYVDYIITRQMVRNRWRVAYYTPENYPLTVHLHRMAELVIGRPLGPGAGQMDSLEYESAKRFLSKGLRYIYAENFQVFRLEQILEAAEYLVQAFGVNALVIDPFNKIEQPLRGETERQHVANVLNSLISFSRRHRVHIFLVAHTRKIGAGLDGLDKVPGLYDINGSADFFNMIDAGLVVYQNFNPENGERLHVDVYVRKVKHKFMGRTGLVPYGFSRSNNRYHLASDHGDFYPWIDDNGSPASRSSPADQFAGPSEQPF